MNNLFAASPWEQGAISNEPWRDWQLTFPSYLDKVTLTFIRTRDEKEE